jgi:hypothetical protein
MGGFSSQVQQPQASQPTSGKGGPIGNAMSAPDGINQPIPESVAQPAVMPPGGGGKGLPPQQVTAQPAVMSPEGGGKGQRNYEQRPSYAPFEPNYAPPDGTRGGKGASTNSATSGQPKMGQPNRYANTIPQWDNASQQLAPAQRSGKGKGG